MKKIATLAAALLLGGSSMAVAQADSVTTEAARDRASIETRSVDVTPRHVTVDDLNAEAKPGEIFEIATLASDNYSYEYRLSKYDVLSLVPIGYKDEIGSQEYTVGPDGRIQLPYVGSIPLAGKTLNEAREIVQEAFGHYYVHPEISLNIKTYGTRKVYVMGEVVKPGVQEMVVDNMNAYAAVSTAGGPNSHGRLSKAQIIRVVDGSIYYRQIDLNKYVKKHDLTQNVVVKDGDIIYVPRTNGLVWQEDVVPILNAMTGVYSVKKLFE
ncbi:MAG: polysaccharide export protein [Selenomonadaceae bacterium]|nr:polysaccharide export protein [Selenomonadaceae bacterium]